jgi:hypothetical protein
MARPRRQGRLGRLLFGGMAMTLIAARVCAADDSALKTAVMFNILLFIEWPGEASLPPQAPLQLCASSSGSLWPQLSKLQDRAVRGMRVQITDTAGGGALKDCRVLIIEGPADSLRQLPRELIGVPVLVVGDGVGATGDGVIMTLQISNGRVTFDADPASARRNGLRLSSRLLHLARNLRE